MEGHPVHPGALLFDDDRTLADHIAEALGEDEPVVEIPAKTQIIKGGVCPYCDGPTTYTRQNDGRGCLKCETERKKS